MSYEHAGITTWRDDDRPTERMVQLREVAYAANIRTEVLREQLRGKVPIHRFTKLERSRLYVSLRDANDILTRLGKPMITENAPRPSGIRW